MQIINESLLSGFHTSMYTIIGAGVLAIVLTLLRIKLPAMNSENSNK